MCTPINVRPADSICPRASGSDFDWLRKLAKPVSNPEYPVARTSRSALRNESKREGSIGHAFVCAPSRIRAAEAVVLDCNLPAAAKAELVRPAPVAPRAATE